MKVFLMVLFLYWLWLRWDIIKELLKILSYALKAGYEKWKEEH